MSFRYQERCITGDSLSFCKDLKIIGDRIVENWWRAEGHRVDVSDIGDILAVTPEVRIIGTGYAGLWKCHSPFIPRLRTATLS